MGKILPLNLIIFVSVIGHSCGPVINFYSVGPLTITSDDSVTINYQIKGRPTLLVHEKIVAEDSFDHKPAEMPIKYLNLPWWQQKERRKPGE